ncbi:MAG: succinate dehydrogenase assembly factor 4 [Alphaproteobacteria bacterium]
MAKDDSSRGTGEKAGSKPNPDPAPLANPQGAKLKDVKLQAAKPPGAAKTPEIGGPKGPEPTRYGDWERDGRCVDF